MFGNKILSNYELVKLLKNSDHSAYTEIYNRYYYLLFTFAYKKLRDEELTKDFVQELFTNLWHNRKKLKEDGNLASYLYINIRSKILDYFAHQEVKVKYTNSLKDFILPTNGNSDHLIRGRQLSEYINMQIQSLPSKMRIVFELSRKQALSNQEIAQKLGSTESNVSHHINNAMKILRVKLNGLMSFIFL